MMRGVQDQTRDEQNIQAQQEKSSSAFLVQRKISSVSARRDFVLGFSQ